MKKVLLALTLFAGISSVAFANDGDKPGKGKGRKDNCTGAAAAKCDKDMASAKMDGMPACCRAKMAAAKAAETKNATAQAKPATKSL
ncbi:MAG: hypothetical protein ACRYFX_03835 [Janthinobacterium lividum]